ncbi:cellulose biosynthesis cyclic di-GMP-binding regulatory protein BcsB [Microvirga pakistanensis]|uniref:cellulose biosynthesis cyclic di-GMP-binding regulatory protein BcsB n=1 Tax=Microvirga pakistanensis TaxID=1682650 RepID=UPI00106CDC7F|nr:cellulose biosynthesis cyclic di-GMP-binding regulatory protein BcsB [Microvirga pakistanensis]
MRSVLIPFLIAFEMLGARTATAQVAPFSMDGAPATPSAPAQRPAQARPPQSGAPPATFDIRGPSPAPRAAAPQNAPLAPKNASGSFQIAPGAVAPRDSSRPAVAATAASPAAPRIERPILPFETIRLEGESDAQSWTFHLTQDEASSGTSITVGYKNAVVVMPEGSRLRIVINGETVIDTPIQSSDNIRPVTAQIRPGLLRAGSNFIRTEAVQRHRTDCTIAATYELWTDVDSASTRLIFAEGATKTLRSLEDLPAVGVDASGVTTIRVVAPKVYRPEIRDRLLRLVQMIALRGRYARPVIQVVESDPGRSPAGTIKVVMGLASELRGLLPGVPDSVMAQPLTMMMQEPGSVGSTLVVSGPTWNDLDSAIAVIGTQAINTGKIDQGIVDTASWHWPEVVTAFGRHSFRFADLGIATQEFSGRRLKSRFMLNLPPDFYATEYGEALLNVEAAYTSAVKPGSHVNIFVNDKISTQLVITAQGDVVKRHAIRLPLKHFKAGLNSVTVEVGLLTDADDRCAPGETLSETNRFVLFDTSSLEFPEFGRIGRQPDLGVLSTGHFPNEDGPTTVVLGRSDTLNIAAAGTFLARMARSAGTPMRTQFASATSAEDASVIFIGAVEQIPPGLLGRVRVSEHLRLVWPATPFQSDASSQQVANTDFTMTLGPSSADRSGTASTDEVRKRWSESFRRQGVLQQTLGSLQDWMEQTFSLSVNSLSLGARIDAPYEPPQRSTLLIAQNRTPEAGVWTLVTARTEEALAEEMARAADPLLWSKVAGRAVALDPREFKLQVEPIQDYDFIQTQPFSLMNLRLVAANWMSANILHYAVLMVACCLLLGMATYLLLKRLGRPS